MVYPLKLRPTYKQYLWGGENLSALGKHSPLSHTGESWELSEHPQAVSLIDNGPFQNKTLTEVRNLWQEKLFGHYYAKAPCPLLVKFLDAEKQLSIQVHPQPREGGKGEVWYIVSAQPGAKIIYGVQQGVTAADMITRLNTPQLTNLCQSVPVAAGEVYYIPPGVIHSLGAGIVAAEVQQCSDITYRLYDFNRKDANGNFRPLHIKEALAALDWRKNQSPQTPILWQQETTAYTQEIYDTRPSFYFSTLTIHKTLTQRTEKERFTTLLCVAGSGTLHWQEGNLPLEKGDTLLLPAYLGEYTLENKQQNTPLILLTASPI
ncbi:MAG: hypothetical protein HFI72_00695 [Peptococcaceae bacterium]|jgi:mannose-6-phosphate isomerase|nr:hypothetical protein [Peptococcaceae bacterium]